MSRPRSSIPQPRRPPARGHTQPDAAAPAEAAKLQAALALQQQGKFDQAEAHYREILKSQPRHFDALQLLATIAAQRKNSAGAVELFDQALKVHPDHANSFNNRGVALRDLERHEDALKSYERAIKIKPDYAEAHYNRGIALRALNRYAEALESYERALKTKPDYVEALNNRGAVLRAMNLHQDALESFDRVLNIRPDHAESHYNRGTALLDLKRPEEALESYDRALKLKPDYAEAFSKRGNALFVLKRLEEALDSCDRALKIKPDHANALSNRGTILHDLKRLEEALDSCDRALEITPEFAEALSNRGAILHDLKRPEEALGSCDRALEIKPEFAEALYNRGNALLDLKRLDEALESYDRALAMKPDYADAHWNESLCRLLTGDFDLGWKKYEWRWKIEPPVDKPRSYAQPLWLGDVPLAGKTLLLHPEQGFGDTLQFCRYAPLLAAQGARVVLEVPPALKELCRTLAGVDTLLATGEALPPFDLHTPLLSLPLALGTRLDSIPVEVPYLHADPTRLAAWHDLLGQHTKPRVGLAWSGRSEHKNDHNRSLPFALLAGGVDDVAEFVCLQKEFREEDEKLVREQGKVRIVSELLNDFADTAALIEILDLVITVDTSVAHLAGALGKPVWILLPFAPDWRWLLERTDSPWYPSARLFRQTRLGQWASVLTEVREALAEYCAGGAETGQAVPKLGHPVTTRPRQPGTAAQENSAKLSAAHAFHQQGRLDQAETLYREILESQPRHFEALQLLATIAAQRKNSAGAVELFNQALKINPDHANSLNNRGVALLDLKRPEDALKSYERAIKIKPDYAEAHYNRGIALRALNRHAEALEGYDNALKLKPDCAEALNNRGAALRAFNRHEDALASYERALKIRPDHPESHYNLGTALLDLKRHEEARESYDRALKLKPDYAEALNNRGNALRDLKRPEEALETYDRALNIQPNYVEALNNRGAALLDLNHHAMALRSYECALKIKPDYAEAHWNESLCRLLTGDFDLGWKKYEWRWKKQPLIGALRNFEQPLWLGEAPLAGKILLLHAEQGFGDTLQFCRYAPLLAARGARVVLEVPAALKALCRTLVGVDEVVAVGEVLPPFDFHIPMMSLPLAFGTRLHSIPAEVPYLRAERERAAVWQALLGERRKPRVGLMWSGKPSHKNDHNRSLPFSLLAQIIDDAAEYICLQKDFRDEDETRVRQQGDVRIVSEGLKDFADTAALIETLDLVITVDTSVAHLAGALGKPVWILLPFAPDWRWLLERRDSPWYPSARLFRQRQYGQWATVLTEVRQALAEHCAGDGKIDQAVPALPKPGRPVAVSPRQAGAADRESRAKLKVAYSLHQQGHLDQAEVLYREILGAQPQCFDALQLLATIAVQRKDSAAAVAMCEQALAIRPDHANSHFNLGIALSDLKRFDQAVRSYDNALRIRSDHAEALLNRGNALRELNRPEDALDSYAGALKIMPDCADALLNRGHVLRGLKRLEEALASYVCALKIRPGDADALLNRGNTLCDLSRPDEAVESYDRALMIRPGYAEVLYNRGNALCALNRLEDALKSYEQGLQIKPRYAEAHYNRGNVLRDLKRSREALESYDRAIRIRPNHADALNNRGAALQELNRAADALASYDRALAIKPDYAGALNNRGAGLIDLNRHAEALESYRRALEIQPDFAEAQWNEALCRLSTGDYELGWLKYEWRWKKQPLIGSLRKFEQPLWLGEAPLAGKTLLLHAEQGFGDTLQFCRYAPLVAAQGARVVLEVPPALKPLCRTLAGVDALLAVGEPLPPFDLHAPLLSLPLALGTRLDTIPAEAPYLHADPKRVSAWHDLLGERTKPRIGLVWSGSTTHKNDHNRSLPFALLAELIDETAEFICLQKEFRSEDEKLVHQHPNLRVVSEQLKDFADTAALIETLDLVITVDTSVAHLAGAMGKPVWILLPFAPDWRWLLDRADSPWYPSARLFRQPQFDQWAPVVAEVRQALGCLPRDTVWGKAHRVPTGSASARKPSLKTQANSAISEINRRHEVIEALQTDMVRWSDENQLESAWGRRAEFAARLIPAGARVLDVGCGAMALEKHLPSGCTYLPCDVVARDSRTKVCDLNSGDFPEDQLQSADMVVMLGVVEYIYKASELLARLAAAGRPVLVSYCPSDNGMTTPRNDLGWVNHYRREEFGTLLRQAGFHVRRCDQIDGVQWLFLAVAESPPTPLPATKKVLVLSYNNVGNFGDRLGYHQIHSVLPPQAVVTHSHFKPWDVPTDDFDMLVLGIGNSLFAPLLTDKLLALLDRIPQKIGIFGTQYRADIPAPRLQAVLDRLDHWYARYGEDVLLYGRGRDNVTHLGDWLINAFPMASGKDERMLKIGKEIWQDLPLDRTIQKIQAHRKVYSTRLHPLLCALTSAEEVAYAEQRENSAAKPSGKFRSLLLDIFGREMPEDQFWNVDRDAVMSYKMFVTRQIEKLQTTLSEALLK